MDPKGAPGRTRERQGRAGQGITKYHRLESEIINRFQTRIGHSGRSEGPFLPGETMVLAHLHRIDLDANMARFYHIDLASTLFGEVAVLRRWGRIGTRGRTSIETCPNSIEAEASAKRTIRQKTNRGYKPVASFGVEEPCSERALILSPTPSSSPALTSISTNTCQTSVPSAALRPHVSRNALRK